jgi:hypothetical protein
LFGAFISVSAVIIYLFGKYYYSSVIRLAK